MRTFVLLLLLTLSVHAWIESDPLPAIPQTSRILTIEDVETYWFNVLRRTEIPRRPSALHPEEQKQWDAEIARLKSHLQRILNGHFRHESEVAMLRHNIIAWQQKGDLEKAKGCKVELWSLLEHQARMETLAQQGQAARRVAEATERQTQALERLAAADDCEPTIIVQEVAPCPPPVRHVHPRPNPPAQPVTPTYPKPSPSPRPYCPVGTPAFPSR